jgi:hypothetical protein
MTLAIIGAISILVVLAFARLIGGSAGTERWPE